MRIAVLLRSGVIIIGLLLFGINRLSAQSCDPFGPDSDDDGFADCLDECPADGIKSVAGFCGCGLIEIDFNTDGVIECVEPCQFDFTQFDGGVCDCPLFRIISQQLGLNFQCGPPPVLRKNFVIDEPPGVIVFRDPLGEVFVRLLFEKITGQQSIRRRAIAPDRKFERSPLRSKTTKLKVNYEAQLSPLNNANDIIRRTSKKNELTLKGLAPGVYNVKYRAVGIKEDGKVAFRTKFSPSRSFEVPLS